MRGRGHNALDGRELFADEKGNFFQVVPFDQQQQVEAPDIR